MIQGFLYIKNNILRTRILKSKLSLKSYNIITKYLKNFLLIQK